MDLYGKPLLERNRKKEKSKQQLCCRIKKMKALVTLKDRQTDKHHQADKPSYKL